MVTTDFLFPIHDDDTSGDFFRFSPRALRSLFPERLWDGYTGGAWGNREALRHVPEWQRINRNAELMPLTEVNEPDCPITVWGRARKRSAPA